VPKRILIAGAGIGGLTAAACLIKAGHDVRIFEQAPELIEVGAGIQMSANAMHVLNDLGLGEAISAASVGVAPQARPTVKRAMAVSLVQPAPRHAWASNAPL